jgi:hypothetical protein
MIDTGKDNDPRSFLCLKQKDLLDQSQRFIVGPPGVPVARAFLAQGRNKGNRT